MYGRAVHGVAMLVLHARRTNREEVLARTRYERGSSLAILLTTRTDHPKQ